MAKIRAGAPSEDELRVSRNSFVDTFPRSFESACRIANTFANDEVIGRAPDYWAKYRDRIRGGDRGRRAGRRRALPRPGAAWSCWSSASGSEIEPGDAQGRATMAQFFDGKVEHLPLRDPLTLAPLAE